MLFNCQVQTWSIGEIKRIQRKVEQCYRYVWSPNSQAPLKKMEAKHRKRWNVRKELRVKSLRLKIERQSLEGFGHILCLLHERRVKKVRKYKENEIQIPTHPPLLDQFGRRNGNGPTRCRGECVGQKREEIRGQGGRSTQ